jgi:hypothetical protein
MPNSRSCHLNRSHQTSAISTAAGTTGSQLGGGRRQVLDRAVQPLAIERAPLRSVRSGTIRRGSAIGEYLRPGMR